MVGGVEGGRAGRRTNIIAVTGGYTDTVMSTQKAGTQQASESRDSILDGLAHNGLRVVEPFKIQIDVVDGTVIVDAPEINEYGEGDTLEEAMADLQASIVELFSDLDEERDRLGADLQRVYETLTRKLRRVDAANGE